MWLIPAYATDIEPPAVTKDEEVARFVDGAWEVVVIPQIPDRPEINPLENEDG